MLYIRLPAGQYYLKLANKFIKNKLVCDSYASTLYIDIEQLQIVFLYSIFIKHVLKKRYEMKNLRP